MKNNSGYLKIIIIVIVLFLSVAVYFLLQQKPVNQNPSLSYENNGDIIEIKNPKQNYTIRFSNNLTADRAMISDQYGKPQENEIKHKSEKSVNFKTEGENFTLEYLPNQIFYQLHYGNQDTTPRPDMEGVFTIKSYTGNLDPKIYWKENLALNDIPDYKYNFTYNEVTINGYKAYQTTSNPSYGSGSIETVIKVNDNHYVVFRTPQWGNMLDNKLYQVYFEMVNSLK